MPIFIEAGIWGLVAASGLLLGAIAADLLFKKISHRFIAAVTGLGGGVLIAIVSADLMHSALKDGHWFSAIGGVLAGAGMFSLLNWRLAAHGAKDRKRCGDCVEQAKETEHKGSGMAIAIGSILDGIPESLVIGLAAVSGDQIGVTVVLGFFLANIPQGLSSASGMKTAGRSRRYIYTIWLTIPLVVGIAAAVGALALASVTPEVPAAILAFAAGAVLAMLAEAMIPEAVHDAPPFIGLITVIGFLGAFMMLRNHG